jgi:hypothetical protein
MAAANFVEWIIRRERAGLCRDNALVAEDA